MADRITRAERVAIEGFIKTNIALARAVSKSRGYLQTDTASISAATALTDGSHIGTIIGIRCTRLAALANDHRDYYDGDGNLIVST